MRSRTGALNTGGSVEGRRAGGGVFLRVRTSASPCGERLGWKRSVITFRWMRSSRTAVLSASLAYFKKAFSSLVAAAGNGWA